MWTKQQYQYTYENNFLKFEFLRERIHIRELFSEDHREFFLYGSFLELCYDFGFPVLENFPPNSLNLHTTSLNSLKYFYPAALEFLNQAEILRLSSPPLERTFAGTSKQENALLPFNNLSKNIETLAEHLYQMKKQNFHQFLNFCYTFDLPEEYFSQFLTSEKNLARLIIAKQMLRICFRKKFG